MRCRSRTLGLDSVARCSIVVVFRQSSSYCKTLSKLDFSHLPAKELEISSSSQCATSANQGAYHPPTTDHNDALYGPFAPLFSKCLFQHVQDSHKGDFLRVVAEDRPAKSPRGL